MPETQPCPWCQRAIQVEVLRVENLSGSVLDPDYAVEVSLAAGTYLPFRCPRCGSSYATMGQAEACSLQCAMRGRARRE